MFDYIYIALRVMVMVVTIGLTLGIVYKLAVDDHMMFALIMMVLFPLSSFPSVQKITSTFLQIIESPMTEFSASIVVGGCLGLLVLWILLAIYCKYMGLIDHLLPDAE